MDQIPPLAWILIALVVLITVAVNAGLIALLRKRTLGDEITRRLRERPPGRMPQSIRRFQEVLRDPFREERNQLNELSGLVSRLNEPAGSQGANAPQAGEGEPPREDRGGSPLS